MNIFTVQFNTTISGKFYLYIRIHKKLHIMYFNFGQYSISNLIVQNYKKKFGLTKFL